MVKKGEWVRIHRQVLSPEQRAPQVPDDTKKCPLEMWSKGYLLHDANIGDEVEVETVIGRVETGKLIEERPYYTHNFGKYVPELLQIDKKIRDILFGGENNG